MTTVDGESTKHSSEMRSGWPAIAVLLMVACSERPSPAVWNGPIDDEVALLEGATHFAIAEVGYAGTVLPDVRSWYRIYRSPEALDSFRHLIQTAKPAGMLYALAGLYFLDREAYREQRAVLSESQQPVYLPGCMPTERTLAQILLEERKPRVQPTFGFDRGPNSLLKVAEKYEKLGWPAYLDELILSRTSTESDY